MSIAEKLPHFTVEQYLELELKAEYQSEYFDGEIYAMSGGSPTHSFIIANSVQAIGNQLADRACRVATQSLKVWAKEENSFMYPDIMVICGPITLAPNTKDAIINPMVVFEVLSPSTSAFDRGGKFRKYKSLPSLKEYVLIEQDEPEIDVFERLPNGDWNLRSYSGLETEIQLNSLGLSVPMKAIYAKIDFPTDLNIPGVFPA